MLARGVGELSGAPGLNFDFQLPAATFVDIDAGDSLSYAATLAGGGPLPAWLTFKPENRTFSGTPTLADLGTLKLQVIVSDSAGAQAQLVVELVIRERIQVDIATPPPAVVAIDEATKPAAVVQPASTTPAKSAADGRSAAAPGPAPRGGGIVSSDQVFGDVAGVGVDEVRAVRRAEVVDVATPQRIGASHSDTVLATAVVAQLGDITLAPTLQGLNGEAWQRRLEEMHRQLEESGDHQQALVASGVAVTGGLSIGYVIWLVRGGVLVSSMLSALPAWQILDPMPVLAAAKQSARGDGDEGSDDELEGLFDGGTNSPPSTPAPDEPQPPSPLAPVLAVAPGATMPLSPTTVFLQGHEVDSR